MSDLARQFGRQLDASLNRLSEALRTVEDQLRFGTRSSAGFAAWKAIRHEVGTLRYRIEGEWGPLSRWRQVDQDRGAPEPGSTHETWDDSDALIGANVSRARESARSVEETLRAAMPALASTAEQIRYRIYATDSDTTGHRARLAKLADARLYVLVTTALCRGPLLETTRLCIEGGAQIVQLREKEMPNREFLPLAQDVRAITRELGALFVVNDRVEIAALCDADGVHQGQDDLTPSDVRKITGQDMIVGVSSHHPNQARAAEESGADYIGVGPIFETKTKEHRQAVGLEYIRSAQAATNLPGFAIGSVNRDTLPRVLEAGARRVAICTGIIGADDPRAAAAWCRARIDERLGETDGEREHAGRRTTSTG